MSPQKSRFTLQQLQQFLLKRLRLGAIPAGPKTIVLAVIVGLLAGYGAVLFTFLIDFVGETTLLPVVKMATENRAYLLVLLFVPAHPPKTAPRMRGQANSKASYPRAKMNSSPTLKNAGRHYSVHAP